MISPAIAGGALAVTVALTGITTYRLTSDHYEGRIASIKLSYVEEAERANEAARAERARINAEADQQVNAMVRELQARQLSSNQLRKEVLNATNSKACIGSGPVRALLGGLRRQQQGPAGAAQGGVPTGTPGAPRVSRRAARSGA